MRSSSERRALIATCAAAGLISAVGQLLLLRELVAVFYGNELILGLILATWMMWVAVGARRLARRWPAASHVEIAGQMLAVLCIGIAAALPVQMACIRASHRLLGLTPGLLVPPAWMILIILCTLAPLCLLLGWQFALAARLLSRRGGRAGSAYVAEGAGAVLGGLLFTFLLARFLQPFQIALCASGLSLVVASCQKQRRHGLWLAGGAALLASVWPLGAWLHHTTLAWQYDGIRFAHDSLYGRIVVTGRGEQRVFWENGVPIFETQGTSVEEMAHLPLLAHPNPQRLLVIGGGISGTLEEMLHHPSVQEVDYVELDPWLIVAARIQLPPSEAQVLDDPRIVLIHTDGRLYVGECRRQETEPFDVIVLDLPEPSTGQLNRFYTREFFAEVRAILSPGGVFALSLPWQENSPSPTLLRLGAGVHHTLAQVFPEIALLPGERLLLLASDTPQAPEPIIWRARLDERNIQAHWVVPSYLDYRLTTDRISQAQEQIQSLADVRVNRDLEPTCYFDDLLAWLSRLGGGQGQLAAAALVSLAAVPPLYLLAWLIALLVAAVWIARRQAIPATVAGMGLAQMALQMLVLLAFQVIHGYIYSQIGLLTAAFMGGLALSSAAAVHWRWLDSERRPRNRLHPWDPRRDPQVTLVWIQGGMVLLALVFPPMLAMSPPAWAFGLIALAAGGLAGLAFPVALACMPGQEENAIGRLYAADLLGGCLGALLTSTLLIPILGIPRTCLAAAAVGLAGMITLLSARPGSVVR